MSGGINANLMYINNKTAYIKFAISVSHAIFNKKETNLNYTYNDNYNTDSPYGS